MLASDDGRPGHYWQVETGVNDFQVTSRGRLYLLRGNSFYGIDDHVHGATWLIDHDVQAITLNRTLRDRIYALKADGTLLASDDGRAGYYWQIQTSVTAFQVNALGRLYVLKSDGSMWASDDHVGGVYFLIDRGVKSMKQSLSGNIYMLKHDGTFLASNDGRPGYYWQIQSSIHSFEISANGRIYVLNFDGSFYGSDDPITGRYFLIDLGVHSFRHSKSGRIFLLKRDGTLLTSDDGRAGYYWQSTSGMIQLEIDNTGRVLALRSNSGLYRLANFTTGVWQELATGVTGLNVSRFGAVLLKTASGSLTKWEPSRTGELILTNNGSLFLHSDGTPLPGSGNGTLLASNVRTFRFDLTTGLILASPYSGDDFYLTEKGQRVAGTWPAPFGGIFIDIAGTIYYSPDGRNLSGGGRTVVLGPRSIVNPQQVIEVRLIPNGSQYSAWILKENGDLWLRSPESTLQQQAAMVAQFLAATDGSAYVLHHDGRLRRRDPQGQWADALSAVQKIVQWKDQILALSREGVLVARSGAAAGDFVSSGGTVGIPADPDRLPTLTLPESSQWREMGRNLRDVAVSSTGTLYVLHQSGLLLGDGPDAPFPLLGLDVQAVETVGKSLYLLRQNGIFQVLDDGAAPVAISEVRSFRVLQQAGQHIVWLLRQNGELWLRSPDGSWSHQVNDVVEFGLTVTGILHLRKSDGSWWHGSAAGKWSQLDSPNILTGPDQSLFLLDNSHLYRYSRGLGSSTAIRLGSRVTKYQVGLDGRAHHLDDQGQQYVDGAVAWGGVRDFTLDAQGRLLQLGHNGNLERLTWGVGWQKLGSSVIKYMVDASGQAHHLQSNGAQYIDGQHKWDGVRDFTLDAQGRLLQLGHNGNLERLTLGVGWQKLGSSVIKYMVDASGQAHHLQSNGAQYIDGQHKWDGVRDFTLDAQGRLLQLGLNGNLERLTWGVGWQKLGSNVTRFIVGPDARTYHLASNGEQYVDGKLTWSGVRDFDLDSRGRMVQLGMNGNLERHTWGSGWERLAENILRFVILPSGNVFSFSTHGEIFVEKQKLTDNIRDIALDNTGTLYALATNGQLVRISRDGSFIPIQSGVTGISLAANGALSISNRPILSPDGTLTILGTDGNDEIIVSSGGVWGWWTGGEGWRSYDGRLHILINGQDVFSASRGAVSKVVVLAGSGDDRAIFRGDHWNEKQVVIDAGAGNDLVQAGTMGTCLISGGDGNDHISAGNYADIVSGGAGSDIIYGGNGNDVLDGGHGDDWLYGGDGDDVLIAGPTGNDSLDPYYEGTRGNDTYIVAGAGWKQDVYEYRKVYRAGGVVHVREDNKGEDQLFWGVGNLEGGTGHRDRMHDDDFWSKVGSVVEVAGPAVAAAVASAVTWGAASPLLAASLGPIATTIVAGGLAGAAGSLASQLTSGLFTGRFDINWASVASGFVSGAVGGMFEKIGSLVGRTVIDSAIAAGAKTLTGAVVSNVLGGSALDWASIAGSVAGSLASGGGGSLVDGTQYFLGSQEVRDAVLGGVDAIAGGGVTDLLGGGSLQLGNVLLSMGLAATRTMQNALQNAVTALVEAAKLSPGEDSMAVTHGQKAAIDKFFATSGMHDVLLLAEWSTDAQKQADYLNGVTDRMQDVYPEWDYRYAMHTSGYGQYFAFVLTAGWKEYLAGNLEKALEFWNELRDPGAMWRKVSSAPTTDPDLLETPSTDVQGAQ